MFVWVFLLYRIEHNVVERHILLFIRTHIVQSKWISYKRCAQLQANHQLLVHLQVFNTIRLTKQFFQQNKQKTQKCSNWWVLMWFLNFDFDKIRIIFIKKNLLSYCELVRIRLCLGYCIRCTKTGSSCWITNCSSCPNCAPCSNCAFCPSFSPCSACPSSCHQPFIIVSILLI